MRLERQFIIVFLERCGGNSCTFLAGSNPIASFGANIRGATNRNFDMNSGDMKINGWPDNRTANENDVYI